ncbi:hypothetical protein ACHWQZ_G003021 [Mnemiopsis leidyi]
MSSSKGRDETVNALDTSLSETGGSDVFTKLSAAHFLSSFEQFKGKIRSLTPKSAFPADGSINEEALLRSVNKTALAEWLGTAIDMLDRAARQIQGAADLETQICSADVENKCLLKEKVEDQRTIIKLQSQLIEKERESVQSFKETVQNEVKSYAGVVASSCATALSPKKLQTVVKSIQDTEDRSRNIMIHGLAEKNGEDLKKSVSDIFSQLGEKPMFSIPCRVGKPVSGSVRPVKVSFPSASVVPALLKKSPNLRQSDTYKNIFITPDRSREERVARRALIQELRQKRKDEPDLTFFIKSGKVQRV